MPRKVTEFGFVPAQAAFNLGFSDMVAKRGFFLSALLGLAGVLAAIFYLRPAYFSANTPAPTVVDDWIGALSGAESTGFERPAHDWALRLPDDHAAHPLAAAELWQMSAQLQGPDLAPMTVQFSVLRQGIIPPADAANGNIWDMRDMYRAHVIASAQPGSPVRGEERFARGFAQLAGYDNEMQELRLDTWALRFAQGTAAAPWQFRAAVDDVSITLELVASKAPLPLAGADAPFQGYAFTRLEVSGTVATPEGEIAVTGLGWFEHVWGELPLPGAGPVISDRLLVQLDTGDDLVLITSRRRDGQGSPAVDALLIDADGQASQIGTQRAKLEFLRLWQGETGVWPVEWQITLDDTVTVTVAPVFAAQEQAFITPVWSGLVRVDGMVNGQPVQGMGLLQLAQGGT
ncbi:MAG: hypothetical protein LAT78_11865 [Roseinatronobacter sp.]|nr:hypothetical protein [Roseinatronobacter sp.]